MICEGLNNCKSANSKYDYHKYKFSYITEQQSPNDYYKSSSTSPRKVSDEEKKKPSGINDKPL